MLEVFDNVTTPKPCLLGSAEGLSQLNSMFGRSASIEFVYDAQFDGVVACLRFQNSTARVGLRGGQVLSWVRPPFKDDVFWCAPKGRLSDPKPLRGGVPICWPWFGAHPDSADAPSHGFARTSDWCVSATAHSETGARLTLRLSMEKNPNEGWPDGAHLSLDVCLNDDLRVCVTTINTGDKAFEISEALHAYLHVGNVGDVTIHGLEKARYFDQLTKKVCARDAKPLKITGETDRIYQNTGDQITAKDPLLGRMILVRKEESDSSVIWNPWVEKSQHLADMSEDDYRRMLCVETANVADHAVTLRPGDVHRMATTYSVKPL